MSPVAVPSNAVNLKDNTVAVTDVLVRAMPLRTQWGMAYSMCPGKLRAVQFLLRFLFFLGISSPFFRVLGAWFFL